MKNNTPDTFSAPDYLTTDEAIVEYLRAALETRDRAFIGDALVAIVDAVERLLTTDDPR